MRNLNELTYIYFLSGVKNLGSVKVKKILSVCPDKESFFELSKKSFKKIPGIDEKISADIIASREDYDKLAGLTVEMLEKAETRGIKVVSMLDDEYPANLKNVFDAPVLLFYKGNLSPNDKYSISIVGTRYPTEYGKNICKKLADGLSELGLPIISGFAKGVDTIAHSAALSKNNLTYAVFGCGVDIIYPAENKKLYGEICEKGALISEFEIGAFPDKVNFPKRNRIISGISLGTIVVESGLKGGSLLTANFALDQDREVFAVPGPVNSKASEGTNELIKKGNAKLIMKVDDIITELESKLKKYLNKTSYTEPEIDIKSLKVHEQKIYSVLSYEPANIDRINELTGLSISECLVNLLSLEFRGLIKQLPGKNFIRI